MNMKIHRIEGGLSTKWRCSFEHFIHQTTKRVHVGPSINRSTLTLLRAHIERTAQGATMLSDSLLGKFRFLIDLRQSKIENLGTNRLA